MTDEEVDLYYMRCIQERRGRTLRKDRTYCPRRQKEYTGPMGEAGCPAMCTSCIWVPPLSDPEHPERSLLGMLKSLETLRRDRAGHWSVTLRGGGSLGADTVELAVLKAIAREQRRG